MTTPDLTSTAAYDQTIIQNAVSFAAALLLGKGRYDHAEATTLAEITELAAKLKADHPKCSREPVISALDADGNRTVIGGVPAKPAKPGKAKAAKPAAPKASKLAKVEAVKPAGKRAEVLANAAAGIVPSAPDFSAPTHKRFVKKLNEVIALAEAGDLKGLRASQISVVSSSPRAIARYRDLCVTALEAQRKAAKAAAKAEPAPPADIPAFLQRN